MNPSIFVVPAPGVIVRDPDHDFKPLPAEGQYVAQTSYWYAQLRDGSVTLAEAPAVQPARPARRAATPAS